MRIEKVKALATYHCLALLRPGCCLGFPSSTSAERLSAALIDRLPNFSQLLVLHSEKRWVSGFGSSKFYVFDLIPDRRRGATDKHQRYGSTRRTAKRRPNSRGSRLFDGDNLGLCSNARGRNI